MLAVSSRQRADPGTPKRVEYALSTKGRALASTIDAISSWAERWITLQGLAAYAGYPAAHLFMSLNRHQGVADTIVQ